LLSQIDRLLACPDARRIRHIVVAQGVSGNRRFRERADLLGVENAVAGGWCAFVAVDDFARISCLPYVGWRFLDYLERNNVALVLRCGRVGVDRGIRGWLLESARQACCRGLVEG
jgi:hypothetical protein